MSLSKSDYDTSRALALLKVHTIEGVQSQKLSPLVQYSLTAGSSSAGVEVQQFLEDVVSGFNLNVLLGNSEVGKTMFLQAIVYHMTATDHGGPCVYFDLKATMAKSRHSGAELHDLFHESMLYKQMPSQTLREITHFMMAQEGASFIIVLDHFNELSCQELPIVADILSKKLLPKAHVIVASHFEAYKLIENIAKNSLKCYFLEGLKRTYEAKIFDCLKIKYRASERTLEYIKRKCPEICTHPGLANRLLTLHKDNSPNTTTKMIEALIVDIINTHSRKYSLPHKLESLATLPDNLLDKIQLISHLAYLATVSGTSQYSMEDLMTYVTLHRGEQYCFKEHGLGLIVMSDPGICSDSAKKFTFLHITIQEFLCAFYLATEPMLDQITLIYHNADILFQYGTHSNVSKYYFGMGTVLNKPILGSSKLNSEATWALKPLLETFISEELQKDEDQDIKREKLLNTYELLMECQDKNLIQKFLSKRERHLTLKLDLKLLSEPLISTLSYVISNSGIAKWNITASEAVHHTADYISMLVKRNSLKTVEVRTHLTADRDNFVIQPLAKGGGQQKFYPAPSIYVRCMREILHRVLQLYSPIKLKSNGTDSSYVSFLACACLKEKFENDQVLSIEPIHAIHWIPVKIKEGKTKSEASKLESSEETEFHRHMMRHNMEYFELVLMMSPLPNRICFKNPSDEKKIEIIELCRSASPELQGGRIEKSLKSHIKSGENTGTDIIAQETSMNPASLSTITELVALPFIIPATFKGLLGMVPNSDQAVHEAVMARQDTNAESNANAPKATSKNHEDVQAMNPQPEIYTSIESKTSASYYSNQQELSPLKMGATAVRQHRPAVAEEYPVSVESYAQRESSHHSTSTFAYQQSHRPHMSFNQPQSFSSQPSTQTNARQSSLPPSLNIQRQVAVPAGTILHSIDRDLFPLNTIQRLPEEDSLIRRGGNGTVFTAVYGQVEFAIKKTAFRNREFTIHKKLKHPNIIQLSCFMFGPPQPQFKRRYYCYHFMPRMTGDLARMVTDKAEMTMMSLSKKYENNPLKLGSIQGNWKYILKELLKGLNYMHSLHIVHRDMKSSNILIKMACNCDNPLVCTCSMKCRVKISDFDSALELDSNGLLQATPYATAQVSSQQKPERVYQITPVGTDGYRSPESSQFILTNDLETLNPLLTVKSDIWSTGLIMMRMLNGTNGPTTQQKLSTLLLYYENETRMTRSPPLTPKFAKVSKKEVDKIMGLDKFRETTSSSTWMRKAVECIGRCVEVDPNKRPTASDLIKDSFLF